MIAESTGSVHGGRRSVVEDALDDGGVLGRSGAEVPGRGIDGGIPKRAWIWAGSAPPWRRRVPKVWRQRLELLHARVRAREAGDPGWYLDAATYLADTLETAAVEDHTVDNEDRPSAEVAAEVLQVTGWPTR